MTLDDAASILDVTEKHVVKLVRLKRIRGSYRWVPKTVVRKVGRTYRHRTVRGTVWTVNGADVRRYRRGR